MVYKLFSFVYQLLIPKYVVDCCIFPDDVIDSYHVSL